MSNGEIVKEIRSLLSDPNAKISPKMCQRLQMAAIADIYEKIDGMSKSLEKIKPVMTVYRIVLWIGSALGLSVIVLLWSLFTHQAEITFK